MVQSASLLTNTHAKLLNQLLGALSSLSEFDDCGIRAVWRQIRFELASMIIWLLRDMRCRADTGEPVRCRDEDKFKWANGLASAIRSTSLCIDARQKDCGAALDEIIACTALLFSSSESAGIITCISGRLDLSALKYRTALIAALYFTLYSLCRDSEGKPRRASACVISAVRNPQSAFQLSLVNGALGSSEINLFDSFEGFTNLVALLEGEFRSWTTIAGETCLSISFRA
ncbi:MAG TPA: hypothetical protein VMB71_07415 [Acetobacteraceae bacterium]|nr:hypothetical protein [Acetobacteraceae bacterium]